MNELASQIFEIIKDYRNHDGFFLTEQDIIDWGNQFGDENVFVLTELLEILPKVYISRKRAKDYIRKHILRYLNKYRYSSVASFLCETEFLIMQKPHKSQPAILELLEEVLNEDYQESYKKYLSYPKINYIYFDDILASGSTIGRDVVKWLKEKDKNLKSNQEKLVNNEIRFAVSLFCIHSWGHSFQKFRIMKDSCENTINKISWFHDYEIQNHAKFRNQKLNIAKPVKGGNLIVNNYFASLPATKYEDYAFRDINTPVNESFFTNKNNRKKFEDILVEKGIEIIEMIHGEVKPNIRPLGLINPEYKILGLGTHFFTWRNIPNNSPLVYWWDVPGHKWKPLFPVANRG